MDATDDPVDIDNEALEYVALDILRERGVNEDPRERSSRDADDEPQGAPFDLETISTFYPKLTEQFFDRNTKRESRDEILPNLQYFAFRYTVAWCSQNPAAVAALYASEGSLTINGGSPSVGRDAITETVRSFMTAFPDLRVSMGRLVPDGDRVQYHWTLTGTNTGPGGTGNAVRISGFERWRLGGDGLILDSQGYFDAADYNRQLAGQTSSS